MELASNLLSIQKYRFRDFIFLLIYSSSFFYYAIFFPSTWLFSIFPLILLIFYLFIIVQFQHLAIFMIFWGGLIAGNLLNSLGISFFKDYYFIIFSAAGLFMLLLSIPYKRYLLLLNLKKPLFWLFLIVSCLSISFLLGPMTLYSKMKYIQVIIKLFVSIFAFTAIIFSNKLNATKLGVVCILTSWFLLSIFVFTNNEIKPESYFTITGLRLNLFSMTKGAPTNEIGLLACYGISLIFGGLHKKYNLIEYLIIILSLGIALSLLNLCGERLFFFLPILIIFTNVYLYQSFSISKIILSLSIIIIIIIITIYAIKSQNNIIYQTFLTDSSLPDRINRTQNWQAAFQIIKKRPLFGSGLGGYKIEFINPEGNPLYPHNIFLELFSELGIVLSFIILSYPLLFFILPKFKAILYFKTHAGDSLNPFIFTCFTSSLISFDLRINYIIFAIILSLWFTMMPKYPAILND